MNDTEAIREAQARVEIAASSPPKSLEGGIATHVLGVYAKRALPDLASRLEAALAENEKLHHGYAIDWFADEMQKTMEANEGDKTGWDDIDIHFALWRMKEEYEEVAALIDSWDHRPEQAEAVIQECADVANFAMMLAHKAALWRREQG